MHCMLHTHTYTHTCMCRKGDRVLVNSQGGHILRTKPATTNEGGIAVGAASLDSPDLIPAKEFIRLFCAGKDS